MVKTDKFKKKSNWIDFRRKVRTMDNFQDIKDDGAVYIGQPKDNLGIDTPQNEIKKKIKYLAEIHNFDLTNNVDKIINAKLRFFGVDDWRLCPCDRDNVERFCCSIQCQKDVKENGTCHCSMFKRKD